MKLYLKLTCLWLTASLLTGCAGGAKVEATPTLDMNSFVTLAAATTFARMTTEAEALPSATPLPSETPIPAPTEVVWPTSIPTIVPIPGVMRANANVRGVPAKSKTHDLGGLLLGQPVKVIGRNDNATWLYILYADSPTGTGWVVAKAITLEAEMGILPILIYPFGEDGDYVMLPPLLYTVSGTPLPPGTPPPGWDKWGTLLQMVNVRVGPSQGFLTIGRLEQGQIVNFTGRIAENAWVQIDYPSGPGGRGWISSELVMPNDGFGHLPYYNILGTPEVSDEAPAATLDPNLTVAPTETPTPPPAAAQGVEAQVISQVNLRSGPAQAYQSLGLLNPNEKVTITGQTLGGVWYQIQWTASPTSVAWVAADYLRVLGDLRGLASYNNEGTLLPGN